MSEKPLPPEDETAKKTADQQTDSPSDTDKPDSTQPTPEVTADNIEQAADSLADQEPADQSEAATSKNTKPDAPATTAPAAESKPGATWPGKVALLLSLLALAAAGYLFWMGQQQNDATAEQQAALRLQIDTALAESQATGEQRLAQLQQQLKTMQQQASQDKANIDELQQRLTRSIQQVTAEQRTSRKDWLLAEVEYLLRLANQRVLMEQTATGALKLLKSADQILKETDDVSIYEVRKTLAADIAALEAVPRLDTEGVFLQLGALNAQVEKLPLLPVSAQHEIPEVLQQVTPETVSDSWNSGLKATWSRLVEQFNSLIVIQHRDEPVEPLLSPQQTYYLQQNLHLMLEQAQQALLLRKTISYQASLNKAGQWIEDYFDPDSSITQSLLRSLEELKAVEVAPEIPDISGSLQSLKAYLAQMTRLKQEEQAQ